MSATIHFDCPNCGHEIRVALAHAGRSGSCHGCSSRVTVPSPPSMSIEDQPGTVVSQDAVGTVEPASDTKVLKNVALMIGGGFAGWLGITILAVDLGIPLNLWTCVIVGLLCGWLFRVIATGNK